MSTKEKYEQTKLAMVPIRDVVIFPFMMVPFVIGRDPWNRDAMRADAFSFGLWQFRAQTGNFQFEFLIELRGL